MNLQDKLKEFRLIQDVRNQEAAICRDKHLQPVVLRLSEFSKHSEDLVSEHNLLIDALEIAVSALEKFRNRFDATDISANTIEQIKIKLRCV